MCVYCVYDIYGEFFSLYKNGLCCHINSATMVSLLHVISLWAVVCTDHTHRFVRIQLTFVCDCVIFLCKSVGGFFCLLQPFLSLS